MEGRLGKDTQGEDDDMNGAVHPQAKDGRPTLEARRSKEDLSSGTVKESGTRPSHCFWTSSLQYCSVLFKSLSF